MGILPEPDDTSTPGFAREYLCEDEDYQGEVPAIYEYLSRVRVDGKDRRPSRLLVYYEDGQAILMLKDPHTGKLLFHAGETIADALQGLNERLNSPPVKGWKVDKRARYN